MSRALELLGLLVLVARLSSSAAQADGRFWWRGRQQQGSMLPGTLPPNGEAATTVRATRPPQPSHIVSTDVAAADETEPSCVCVEYYLCGTDGYIITTGEGIVDVRAGDGLTGPPCTGIKTCCKRPRNVDRAVTTTTTTTTTESPLYPLEDCGIRGGDIISNMVDVRILSGNNSGGAEFAEFPWMLVLLRTQASSSSGEQNRNVFVCGASLVHPRVAITAAHCVSRRRMSELKLRAGEWDTQSETEPLPHQDRRVSRVVVHPAFYEGTLFYDVALLFVDSPFQLARNVRPICLPQQGDVLEGSRCIATGWGRNAFGPNGTYEMTMKMVELPVVAHDTCQNSLRETRLSSFFNLHESFVCAGGELGHDTCQGDGGGPLFCRSPRDSGRYVQLGITSWGIGCGDTDVPAVYANVPHFADWVASQLPETSGLIDRGSPVVSAESPRRHA